MSIAFRLVLLVSLAFGAVWLYHLRSPELDYWLERRGPPASLEGPASFSSRLDRIPDPSRSVTAWFRGEPPARARPRPGRGAPGMEGYREEGDPRGEEAFDVGEEAAGAESLLAAEDLPAEETLDAGAEAAGEAGEEGGVADPAPGGEPAPPAGGEMAGGGLTQVVYEVKDGDSLWKVAENLLGAGHRYREIVAWNPEVLAASEVLHAGARLKLFVPSPPESLKAPDAPADIAVEEGSPPAEPELETPSGEEPSASPKPAQVVLHRVKENENLRKIAKHYLPAEPQGWRRIFVANEDRLVSPDKIKQGQLLKIPLKDPAGGIGN